MFMFSLSFSLTKSMGTVFHKTRPVKDVHTGKRHLGYRERNNEIVVLLY